MASTGYDQSLDMELWKTSETSPKGLYATIMSYNGGEAKLGFQRVYNGQVRAGGRWTFEDLEWLKSQLPTLEKALNHFNNNKQSHPQPQQQVQQQVPIQQNFTTPNNNFQSAFQNTGNPFGTTKPSEDTVPF